jgi:hypothetical protein
MHCCSWRMWLEKTSDDSGTTHWVDANTKRCPKCKSNVEKSSGCNLVVCRCGQVPNHLETHLCLRAGPLLPFIRDALQTADMLLCHRKKRVLVRAFVGILLAVWWGDRDQPHIHIDFWPYLWQVCIDFLPPAAKCFLYTHVCFQTSRHIGCEGSAICLLCRVAHWVDQGQSTSRLIPQV